MNNFRKVNNISGWVIFAIATLVYTLTVEPTASLWDCAEFIAVSYKLEVPHPPGAPFFLLVGRMFSFLAMGDVEQVAYWINMSSVISSGFTILFLYWTIVLLAKKVLGIKTGEETESQSYLLIGAGAIGALAYTFSDSFWFSAVEAEVYALSSFFTAFVFWAILKWELIEDRSQSNRWLILIAYMMGLSIGVHLLNLVTIPCLGLIYYFKRYTSNSFGIIITLLIGFVLIGVVLIGVIPGIPSVAYAIEVQFVNSFGLPFGSGIVFFSVLFIGGIVYGLIYSIRRQKELINTALLCFSFILIGYSSYSIIVIRSNFDPLINENSPDDVASFISYLKREQYGEWPLLYGPYYNAEVLDQKRGAPVYVKGKDEYEVSRYKIKYEYDPERSTIFPRMHSNRPDHVRAYRSAMGLGSDEVPSFFENIVFMFKRQFGHMYFRYFMWNFSGRESDVQDATWLTPFDSASDLPETIRNNKARNNYYMLPLLLGLLGMFFHFKKDQKSFSVIAMLFFLTGLAIVIYLNPPPIEPRERDYIHVGSFYAFAIWIGFGVIALAQLLAKFIKNEKMVPVAATVISLVVPLLMGTQGWDDHDRSNRYFSVDAAKNILNACAPNAILFTGGDNDTFPLWYVQEVEGFRTDVRVIVLTYFNTDWYLNQMRRQSYLSEPLPFSIASETYKQGGLNDYLPLVENPNLQGRAISLRQFIKLVRDNSKAIQVPTRMDGTNINTVPSKTFFINVDTAKVLASGLIPENLRDKVVSRMEIPLKERALEKKDLMILDLIATNNWERPIYFNNTSLIGTGIDVSRYVVQEGSTFRLLPVYNANTNESNVNTDLMYTNMMERSFWRELNNPNVYYNTEDYLNRSITPFRSQFTTLAKALLAEGKTEKAREVIMKSLELMPDDVVPYDYTIAETIDVLRDLGEKELALEIAEVVVKRNDENLAYYIDKGYGGRSREVQLEIFLMNQIIRTLQQEGKTELATEYNTKLKQHYTRVGG
ncbi:DUF2723 domain-containing protein [Fulvivirgaceae bacterium BMA10]|uniref:DUF2723 domain-containing protein n=1 Tax=Splendidivirga corallicola TaxID=3051826 RepID=A0ABT8KJC3_9BACT|nr:DUF2723 domain-containing protein [Fulvivirgaceae bacterium BMA10]